MDFFDADNFIVNKRLQVAAGLWPYLDKGKKTLLRTIFITVFSLMYIPHIHGILVHSRTKDFKQVFENLGIMFFFSSVFTKLITAVVFEAQLKILYDMVMKNWRIIKDKEERELLNYFARRGKLLTIAYLGYAIAAGILYTTLPLYSVIMDRVYPLNESRPFVPILNGEYFFDKDEYYKGVYILNYICCFMLMMPTMGADGMYIICTEHCLSLFDIVRHRLTKTGEGGSDGKIEDLSYDSMRRINLLHAEALKFADLLQSTYSKPFFFIIAINTLHISLLSVLTLIVMEDDKVLFVRFSLIIVGLLFHLFYMVWPGQKLIDHSGDLYRDAYSSGWYEASKKTKVLLYFFILRCSKPCELSAGGVFTMNFENYMKVLKTSGSYITFYLSVV